MGRHDRTLEKAKPQCKITVNRRVRLCALESARAAPGTVTRGAVEVHPQSGSFTREQSPCAGEDTRQDHSCFRTHAEVARDASHGVVRYLSSIEWPGVGSFDQHYRTAMKETLYPVSVIVAQSTAYDEPRF